MRLSALRWNARNRVGHADTATVEGGRAPALAPEPESPDEWHQSAQLLQIDVHAIIARVEAFVARIIFGCMQGLSGKHRDRLWWKIPRKGAADSDARERVARQA